MNNNQRPRVRFAPSPTGYLHIGGARTCLFNWLYARQSSGEFILRVEDTDLERSKKEYLDEILESIKWLGLDWDEIYHQSQRFDIYQDHAQQLIDKGVAYRKEGAIFFKYDFNQISVDDLIRGEIIFKELPKHEEVIIKSDNSPTYNFSCVVDDALMKINCIIRGEDHISNTPKQILMYKALGFKAPRFAHLPLILSPCGGRMSKRYGATSIREYQDAGYLHEALVNYLLLLGWSPGNDKEIMSLDEAKQDFNIKKVNKTGAVFALDRLNWMNGEHIRKKSMFEFTKLVREYLERKSLIPESVGDETLEKICSLFKERAVTLSNLIEWTKYIFHDNFKYSDDAEEILKNNISEKIEFLAKAMSEVTDFSKHKIEEKFRAAAGDLGVKLKVLVHPTRVALTGRKTGAGLFETMEVLGKDKVLARLNRLLDYWKKEGT